MKILVTGGTGFIGSILVQQLLREGNQVAVLVRDNRKFSSSMKSKVELYEADISDLASLKSIVPSIKNVDIIFHLAACIDYNAGREKLFLTNVGGTLNLLNFALDYRIKKFVFISSIEAIGPIKREDIPVDEAHACQPVNFYGESKLEAEKHVKRVGEEGKVETIILRLGNVYGPESLSFILLISKAILNYDKRWLFLNSNRYIWHPVYIEDVIEGIIKAGTKPGIKGIFILAGAQYVPLRILSELISQELGIDIRTLKLKIFEKIYFHLRIKANKLLNFFVSPYEERIHWAYSIENAKNELNYFPRVNLKEGIRKTIDWAKERNIL